MTVGDFIKACSRAYNDPKRVLINGQEWLEILNFQSGELFPEIAYEQTVTEKISDLGTEYQLDLSSYTFEQVKEVFVEDNNGNKYPYDNWVYWSSQQILDLDPETSRTPSISIGSYKNVMVILQGPLPEDTRTSTTINLSLPKLNILKKVCVREALLRTLNDHAKLDRYRILTGRMNEYALMAMIRDLTTTIELEKRKLTDTKQVFAF